VDDAYQIYEKSKKIMAEGGFNLRKWCTNSRELCDVRQIISLGSSDVKEVVKVEHVVKVLGLNWNFARDTFVFRFDDIIKLASELPSSKRSILKIIAKVFDPLGVLTPIFTEMKVLFQELCQSKLGWDEPLSERLYHKWQRWM
jgi:hypothetical protein